MTKYVAHIVPEYLGHTLNWIHTQIKYVKSYTPYILTRRVMNIQEYPVDKIFVSRNPNTAANPMSITERIIRRAGIMPQVDFRCFSSALALKRPQFIHAHFGWDGYFSLGLKKKHNLPLVTRFYGYDVGIMPKIPLWQRRYRRLFREGDLFIVEGRNMKSILIDLGCPPEKIAVHHLGIELDQIKYMQRVPVPGTLRVLIAGTFKEKKGIEYALRAIAGVRKKMPGTYLPVTIIGDGPLRNELHALAKQLNIDENITWLGYQPHSVFMKSLYDVDVFLSPSVYAANGDTEGGAPVAIIEAGASGLPVVSTTHADIPEVVLNGKTGSLAPERDVNALIDMISNFIQNPYICREYGENARAHIEKNYEAVVQGHKLAEIYSMILS